jgi:hypothetical protein
LDFVPQAEEPSNLRRAQQQYTNNNNNNSTAKSKEGCLVVISHKQFEDKQVRAQPLECELQGADLNGRTYQMVRVANRTTDWAKNNNLVSGASTIFATAGAEINYAKGELIIPQGSAIQVRLQLHVALSFPPQVCMMS